MITLNPEDISYPFDGLINKYCCMQKKDSKGSKSIAIFYVIGIVKRNPF